MKGLRLFLIFSLAFLNAYAQSDRPIYSIFLMGDAGEQSIVASDQILSMRAQMLGMQSKSSVIFLGDNIYPRGMPSEDDKYRGIAESIIRGQLDAAEGYQGDVFMVPGNHDWEKGHKEGLFTNAEQEEYVQSYFDSLNIYLPDNGCPGPVEVQLAEDITLILLNSQWFLHPWVKPGIDEGCQAQSVDGVLTLIEDIFLRNEGKKIVVASHHPMFTYGIHGGRATFRDHLFPLTNVVDGLYLPLPIIGSIYPFYRKYAGSLQDLANPVYKSYRNKLVDLMEKYKNIIHVAGHEHSLQFSKNNNVNYVVSGSGSKTTPVKMKGYARFVSETIGFAKLDFFENGKSDIVFLDQNGEEIYREEMFRSIYTPPETLSKAFLNIPKDSTVVSYASKQYLIDSSKYWLLGANYRHVWAAQINAPLLDLGNEKGGLTILKRGGGMQTKSLRMEAKDGRQYVIRSVEKFAEKAVPLNLQGTFAADLVQDQVSASNPYGAIAVPVLAEAANVYHANPKLLVVPNDPRFGSYRGDFSNMLVLFEERPSGNREDVPSFGSPKKIVSTADLLESIYKDNDNTVDQHWVLKSRLFDLYIGDWDRHDDQWRWARFKTSKGHLFRPIPRDRDNAFFVNQGFLMSIVKRKWAMPKFQGFDYELKNPEGFMFNARHFDRSFLSEMNREDWINTADTISSLMTDNIINDAIGIWPDTIQKLMGNEVKSKLKVRREKLGEWGLKYYDFLAEVVNVTGSNKREYFKVERINSNETRVRVFKSKKDNLMDKLIYDRTFLRNETKEVRLYGLKGKDIFDVSGDVSKSIKIRIIGGPGHDSIVDNSHVSALARKTVVYDTRNTYLKKSSETISKLSDNPEINKYDRKDFKYNFLAPIVLLNYNVDDGIFIGGGFLATKHGFRKDPFSSQHSFLGSIAPKTFSWDFKYQSTYTHVIRKLDLKINATMQAPNHTSNFFGIGNETVFDKTIHETKNVDNAIEYYRVRYEFYSLEGLLSKKFGEKVNFDFGFHWQGFITQQDYEGEDRSILDYTQITGDSSIFEFKTYQGIVLKLIIDTRDNKVLPENGIFWDTDLRVYTGLNDASNRFTQLNTDLTLFRTLRLPTKLTLGLRVGFGQNFGSYEYYQGQILGGVRHLRGYRKTRFLGDRKVYSNLEARYHLRSSRLFGIPSTMGLNGFYDAGRVWVDGESSDKIHRSFGGGVWFAPLNATVLSFEIGSSPEETRFYFRLGFLF